MKIVNGIVLGTGLALAWAGCVSPAGTPRADFRIVTYNIHHGATMEGTLDLAAAGKVIAAERPRFAGIQEVDVNTGRIGGRSNLDALVAETGMVATFAQAIPFRGGAYGNAVLSREKPLSVRRIPLPGGEPRVLLLCEFGDCWFGTTHLAVDSARAREKSVSLIREAVAACAPKPVFLCGDWNSEPDSPTLKGLQEFLTVLTPKDRNTYHGGRAVVRPTDRDFCIDYIAVDTAHAAGWQTLDARVIQDCRTSDHFPLVVRVRDVPQG